MHLWPKGSPRAARCYKRNERVGVTLLRFALWQWLLRCFAFFRGVIPSNMTLTFFWRVVTPVVCNFVSVHSLSLYVWLQLVARMAGGKSAVDVCQPTTLAASSTFLATVFQTTKKDIPPWFRPRPCPTPKHSMNGVCGAEACLCTCLSG